MQEEFQIEKEISIIEILRALLSKIVYLVLALIIGAAAGGVYGYMTSKDVITYGTSLTFYINPTNNEDKVEGESIYSSYGAYSVNVMNNMIGLLNSQMFAARLLDGMMERDVVGTPATKYNQDGTLSQTYKNWISLLNNSVKYSYKGEGNIAESFVNISISIDSGANGGKGYKTADEISKQVQASVKSFVEEYMPVPNGYASTNCELLTEITDIKVINGSYKSTVTTKYALILGAISFIVAAAVVIVMYMSDKRLRDIDVITKSFNLPVLGVLPSIDVEKEEQKDKGGKA